MFVELLISNSSRSCTQCASSWTDHCFCLIKHTGVSTRVFFAWHWGDKMSLSGFFRRRFFFFFPCYDIKERLQYLIRGKMFEPLCKQVSARCSLLYLWSLRRRTSGVLITGKSPQPSPVLRWCDIHHVLVHVCFQWTESEHSNQQRATTAERRLVCRSSFYRRNTETPVKQIPLYCLLLALLPHLAVGRKPLPCYIS